MPVINPSGETPALSEEQARVAYQAILAGLQDNYGDPDDPFVAHPTVQQGSGVSWPSGPVLCRDFEGWATDAAWAVVWEGGPFEWAMFVPNGGETGHEFGLRLVVKPTQLPDGVDAEPFNSWAVSLYPADVPAVVPAQVQA